MKKSIVALNLAVVMSTMSIFPSMAWFGMSDCSDYRQYVHDDGTPIKNEWYSYLSGSGATYHMYIGEEGTPLLNGITPDGYNVNSYGAWYTSAPYAAICEAEYEYHNPNGETYYPTSFDGSVAKNDVLGWSLKYSEDDLNKGYNLSIDNSFSEGGAFTAVDLYGFRGVFEISLYYLSHTDANTIKSETREANQNQYSDGVSEYSYVEQEISGRKLYGSLYRSDYAVEKTLYYPLPVGEKDLCIYIKTDEKTAPSMAEIEAWLNSNLTLQ